MRTRKSTRKYNVYTSRLELELYEGHNETAIYECRAMNVAAREPAVGAYTLLALPSNYTLIPMGATLATHPPSDAHQDKRAKNQRPYKDSTSGEQEATIAPLAEQAATKQVSNMQQSTTTTTVATTTTTTTPTTTTSTSASSNNQQQIAKSQSLDLDHSNSIAPQPAPNVGQACPREAADNFCLNKGTCVHNWHIGEYFCK